MKKEITIIQRTTFCRDSNLENKLATITENQKILFNMLVNINEKLNKLEEKIGYKI